MENTTCRVSGSDWDDGADCVFSAFVGAHGSSIALSFSREMAVLATQSSEAHLGSANSNLHSKSSMPPVALCV
jgi:hypothetical protein